MMFGMRMKKTVAALLLIQGFVCVGDNVIPISLRSAVRAATVVGALGITGYATRSFARGCQKTLGLFPAYVGTFAAAIQNCLPATKGDVKALKKLVEKRSTQILDELSLFQESQAVHNEKAEDSLGRIESDVTGVRADIIGVTNRLEAFQASQKTANAESRQLQIGIASDIKKVQGDVQTVGTCVNELGKKVSCDNLTLFQAIRRVTKTSRTSHAQLARQGKSHAEAVLALLNSNQESTNAQFAALRVALDCNRSDKALRGIGLEGGQFKKKTPLIVASTLAGLFG